MKTNFRNKNCMKPRFHNEVQSNLEMILHVYRYWYACIGDWVVWAKSVSNSLTRQPFIVSYLFARDNQQWAVFFQRYHIIALKKLYPL